MKGGLAAMIVAAKAIKSADVPLKRSLMIAALVDEEVSELGAKHFIQRGQTAQFAIVGEPTELKLCTSQRGQLSYEITTMGKAAHASMPKAGINAINKMGRVLDAIESISGKLASRRHNLLGSPTINVGIITGGLATEVSKRKTAATAVQRLDASIAEKLGEQPRSFIRVRINGEWHDFDVEEDIQPSDTLAYLLRERLGLTGLKVACDEGSCGACTVIMDGKPVLSCMTLAVEANGHEILTVEGLERDDPVVEAFAEQSEPGYGTALQCGHCTPGFVMAAKALLSVNPKPTLDEVKEALSGNICRCGCYAAIAQAVLHASEKIAERASKR